MFTPASLLAASPLFEGLPAPHLNALAASVSNRRIPRRGILFREGTPGTFVYVLVSGAIQAHKSQADGTERVIRIFKPGEMFAQVILFERADYPVTTIALEPSTVLGIPRQAVLDLLGDASFRHAFIAGLMQRQRFLADRIATLSTTDVGQRFRTFLADRYGRFTRVDCRLKRKEVAAAIGVTPETLSRLLGRLKTRGDLIWQDREIRVHARYWRDA
jgi:CRP/FNR family transcriptional regulator